ncbi:single-stranded-DNA-specific exonuclease RecJ [Candidatus Uhrbacteria bacterium]|nr:single-stranded-DNA-specific exonuclease RecJ [Candidatus Uhrbacteria bacterium]
MPLPEINTTVTTSARLCERKWRFAEEAPPEFLATAQGMPAPLAHLCYQRGLRTWESVQEFLHPDYATHLHDPWSFRHMERVVDRIWFARERGEHILVHGDYDADGVSGAAMLSETLEALGCTTDVFIPHRERDGYGFTAAALAYARERDIRVIVTCDCGIANAATIATAQERGIDVVVTDHHCIPTDATGAAVLPPAYAILHPGVPGETYPFPHLTGGGVAFKLCVALVQRDRASAAPRLPRGFEKWLLDCVAIATVADLGVLMGENRVLVRYGLTVLEKTRRPGLRALYDLARITPERITPTTIGFQIAPRMNAAGRLAHARTAWELLRATEAPHARVLAEQLETWNTERQRLVEDAAREAIAQVGDRGARRSVVAVGAEWSPGIVGLVATRLREQYACPAFALTTAGEKIVGSGRSVEGFDIVEALRAASDTLAAFGGHPQACGFTVKSAADIAVFTERVDAYAQLHCTEEQLVPTLRVDLVLEFAALSWEFAEQLAQLGPFGVGHPAPLFCFRAVRIEAVRAMGASGRHARLGMREVRSGMVRSVVVFSYMDRFPHLVPGMVVDLVAEVEPREWNGQREVQVRAVDMRVTAEHI